MQFVQLPPGTLESLDQKLLDDAGRIRLHPTSFCADIPTIHLRAWCVKNARYQIPTVELVEWLKRIINDRPAIEIGSGNGDLYFHLGIPGADNYCQQKLDVQLYYKLLKQPPTNPPPDVLQLDAVEAIKQFAPEVVIGAWITQKAYHDDPIGHGNMYGPGEEEIIRHSHYVHIGNSVVHGTKRILKYPHDCFSPVGLVSRAQDSECNCIYSWKKL